MPPYGLLKGNSEFFLNAVSWVNARSETISIRAKSLFKLPLRMSALQAVLFSGIFAILLPAVILILGLVIHLKRRHL